MNGGEDDEHGPEPVAAPRAAPSPKVHNPIGAREAEPAIDPRASWQQKSVLTIDKAVLSDSRSILRMEKMTGAQYDALKNAGQTVATTMYVIVG